MSLVINELDSSTPKMLDVSDDYKEIFMLGKVLCASGYFRDIKDQAQAITKILWGRELGFSPIVSMSGIHIIESKPALSSNLMATLIKRSGKYDYRVKTWTHTECVLTFRERGSASSGNGSWEVVGESSFTMEDAKAAGVVRQGGSWTKYPKPMLFARALSQGMRTYCPDVSASPLYVPEEMGATVNEDGDVTELPKSARPVERTTEEIPLEPREKKIVPAFPQYPANTTSAAADRPQDGQGTTKPTSDVASVQAADKDSTAGIDRVPDSEAASGMSTASPAVEYISIGQQKNFHKECRAAVRPARSMEADNLTYQWLLDNGYYDEDKQNGAVVKVPTASKIPAAGWITTRNKAIAWLKVQ